MKFFKFKIEGYNNEKYFFETHYFNVEDIKDIVVSSSIGNNEFIVRTRGGAIFHIKKDYLNGLLKLVNIDENDYKK